MGPHTAHLSFEDHRFGKFVYELAGGAEHPQPMSEHKAEVDIKPQMSNIVVSFLNNPLELAKRTFLEKHPLAKVKEGDHLAMLSAGAYGFVMAGTYNTRPMPAEVLVNGKKAAVVRKRQKVKDIWAGESTAPWQK